MAAGNHAKDVEDALADLSTIKVRAGCCWPCGTADAPRDGEGGTRAIPMVLAL